MREDIKTLLDRREEIKNQMNKLSKEYTAIGNIITELHRYKKEEKERNYERD